MKIFRISENRLSVYLALKCLVILSLRIQKTSCQEDEGPYRGKFIGKINSYHHQVSGEVYAVNEFTFLMVNFNYDGNGLDTYFWSGASNRPGHQGFIVPDEYGKTNILERYFNREFTLKLPDGKKIREIKWLAIYDLGSQNNFGDIYIPEEFEPPLPQNVGSMSKGKHNVSSDTVTILDSKTIRIPNFSYDGHGKDVHFYVGVGAQPVNKGNKIPDELGYLDSIRAYDQETIVLELPGDMTVFQIDWLSIFDLEANENYGSVLIPDGLNVPPSLTKIIPHKQALPNCRQLHKDLQVSWEVFGPAITLTLSGQVKENDYMAFGISGSDSSSQMLGSDVAVAYIDGHRGYATDYNITALAPCVNVLGQSKGVCRDDVVGGLDSFQLHTFSREDGINIITFRRDLISSDHGDKMFVLDRPIFVIWALGSLDSNKEPTFHEIYPKRDIQIHFNTSTNFNDCTAFTAGPPPTPVEIWERNVIFDDKIRTYTATLGPSGGKKGYTGITGHVSNGLAWYINGFLVPELRLRRGWSYKFLVRGGNNPHSVEHYHPFVITDEPQGGFNRLSDSKQNEVRVLAGVEFTRRGRPKPTAAGPLCVSKYPDNYDRRLDDNFLTFRKFNRTLKSHCDAGEPSILEVMPNSSWPDTVYYNSFTHANMGWKINIVDKSTGRTGSASFVLVNANLVCLMIGLWKLFS